MKKIILTIATAMISVFATAQIQTPAIDSVVSDQSLSQAILESSGFSNIYDLAYRKVGNLGGGGPTRFKLCSSMNPMPKVESQGAMFFLSGSITPHVFEVAGFICYFPKEIWNNEKLKNLWMQDNSNWILVFQAENSNNQKFNFIGSEYQTQLTEWDEVNNKTTGLWYMNGYPTNNGFGDTYGMWWNNKQFQQGFKSLYLTFDTLTP